MKLKNLLSQVINWGVTPGMKVEAAQIVRLTNVFGLFPILVYLILIFVGLFLGIDFYVIVCGAMIAVNALVLWFNYQRQYAVAKTIILSVTSIMILISNNAVQDNYPVIAYFFPLLTCFVFFYDMRKEFKAAAVNLVVTVTCMALCFVLPTYTLGEVHISEGNFEIIGRVNYVLAFSVFLIYLYITTKFKLQSETLLIQARETAELMARNAEKMARQLTIQKEKAERERNAKSLFLSNMSHELRTPLNGIIGTTHLLLQENNNPALCSQLDVLKYSSEHMLAVINDILDFNKIEAGKLLLDRNIFNLQTLVEKIHAVFQHQFKAKGLDFIIETDQRINTEVISDDTRLNQILSNLISNALKFTRNGSVKFSVQLISATSDTMMLRFVVADTGIGIPKGKSEQIFQSFTQAHATTNREFGGTGLGLTISKKLVEKFGGELEVKSEEGKGSEFYFSIPIKLNCDKSRFVNETRVKDLKALNGIRVLVAEDNKINMIVTKRFLEKWNVEISEASNGLEALNLFKEKEFDVLLIDLEMPVMDGYEAITEIRKLNLKVPAIAFTAAVFDDMRGKLLSFGFSDFVNKPFRPEDLHEKICAYAYPQYTR
jgi:signal transduction histidine kinase/CheY-like chemotaxis protein